MIYGVSMENISKGSMEHDSPRIIDAKKSITCKNKINYKKIEQHFDILY